MFSRARLFSLIHRGILETADSTHALPATQLVRWRKRRWAPKAPSKIYYVPEAQRQERNMEEILELRQRYNHYRTTIRALNQHIKAEVISKQAAMTSTALLDEEEQEFIELLTVNDAWNKETAKVREARQEKEANETEEKRISEIIAVEAEKEKQLIQAEEHVKAVKEKAKEFITAETLESEIEKALNLRVSYNFAIDVEGNRYVETSAGSTVVETGGVDKPRHFPLEETTKEEKAQAQQ